MAERHRKRPAVEPAAALLGRTEPVAADARRPAATALGAILVAARAIAALLWLLVLSWLWPDIAAEQRLGGEESAILYGVVSGVFGVGALVLAVAAWLIWRGSDLARILTMSALTISIVTAAAGHFAWEERITIHTSLLTVSLDILVLLALSSRESRAWARRARARRARRR